MKKLILNFILFVLIFNLSYSFSQVNYQENLITKEVENALESNYQYSKIYFDEAYEQYPDVPKGMLEAVSYHYTHFMHITESTPESCTGLPRVYGIMGLTLNGKNYFRNNLITVAELSGYTVKEIIEDPAINVKAFAAAFSAIKSDLNIESSTPEDMTKILIALSELNINNETAINDFTMNLYLYGIFKFLCNTEYQKKYGYPEYSINFKALFGENNLKIFQTSRVNISYGSVTDNNGTLYAPTDITVACPDYNFSNCSWVASPNHYSGWNGHTISSVTMHTVQGSYTSCINWFQNTDASAATHYVVASNSSYAGQVTQMVNETNAGWHVGSENWYTIGYEHEGFVDDPSWYTVTMYQTSAALTRDVCTDHNINTLRMFYRDTIDDGTALDYGVHSLGGEGSCVKIKGHQHYPNQTHTDPAQNWYWDYYFKLVNPNYTTTTYTAATGNFFDSGGSGANYTDDERLVWLIQPSGGASEISLSFTSFALEDNYDFLYIYDGNDVYSPLIGRYNTNSPGTVTAYSGSICIEFRSDCLTNEAGWEASWTSVQPDLTSPTTAISVTNNWQTQDFTASFTDADEVGGSGLEKRFYQVLDFDGTEWHANADNGFFADNFDSFNGTIWTVPASSGTWTVSGGNIIQSDTSVNNSNVYASLNQNLSNRYLYQFYVKIDAATFGTSQHRFGFHFFSDDGSLPNRGNSYFIFFRQESSQLEFYRVANDSYTQTKIVTGITTNFGQWYDVKIIFDRITGKIDVYRDNVILGTWTDPAPLSNSGDYIAFRTGNCKASVGELKVYRSRNSSLNVTVGPASTNDIRFQNPDPATYGAKIKSIVNDSMGNLSSIAYYDLNIDWTPPACVSVYDGSTQTDIDTSSSLTTLSANWTASGDTNSGLAKYWYAIGTTVGATDIVNWTDNALNTSVTASGLSLSAGQTYFFSIKSENGAALTCISNSDGVTISNQTIADFTINPTTVCAGDSILFTNTSINANSYFWTFPGGNPANSSITNPLVTYSTAGSYTVELIAVGSSSSDTLIQQISVNANPVADFSSPDTNLAVGGALALFTNNSTDASSYLWDFGDGNSSTDVNPWNIYTSMGDYTVTLIAYSTLCGTDTLILTDYVHVGVTGILENPNIANFNAQPNPFNEDLYISFTLLNDENIRLVILDMLGREVELLNKKLASGDNKIVFRNIELASGTYFLKLITTEQNKIFKLIKY